MAAMKHMQHGCASAPKDWAAHHIKNITAILLRHNTILKTVHDKCMLYRDEFAAAPVIAFIFNWAILKCGILGVICCKQAD